MEIQIFGFKSWNSELVQRSIEGRVKVSPSMVLVNQMFWKMYEVIYIHIQGLTITFMHLPPCAYIASTV